MPTGESRNRIDATWNVIYAGGISNPMTVVEQLTCLFLMKWLDTEHTREEAKPATLKMVENSVVRAEDLPRAAGEGLGLFIRSLVDLDSVAVREAFSKFILDSSFTARQHEFIELVIEYLSCSGAIKLEFLYESPFNDLALEGRQSLFSEAQVSELISVIERVNSTVVAA